MKIVLSNICNYVSQCVMKPQCTFIEWSANILILGTFTTWLIVSGKIEFSRVTNTFRFFHM